MLTAYLSGRAQPCPQCGYNLRDLQGDRCPECGDALQLRLGLAEPRQGLLIGGLVGLSAGAGLSGLLLIYIAIQVLRDRGGIAGVEWSFIRVTAVGLLVEGSAVAGWLSRWRRIRMTGRTTRLGLVLACWGLSLANLLAFTFTIK